MRCGKEMGVREEQKQKRKNDILNAAIDLFIQKGYGGTRISDIASSVGMSVGLLFHYYESKECLYEDILMMGARGPQAMMQIDHSDPIAFFEAVAGAIFQAIRESPLVGKIFVLMGQASMQEISNQKLKEALTKVTNIEESVPIIKKGQELGQIKEGDPLALSIAFWGAIQGVAQACAAGNCVMVPDGKWIVDIIRK